MQFLLKYWRKYRLPCVVSVLCVSAEAVCDLIQPRIMSRLIDDGVRGMDLRYVLRMALLMLGVTGLGAVFACSRNILSSNASQRFGADLRKDLFVKIQRLPIISLDGFDGGSLVTRVTNDVTQVANFFNGLMRVFFKAPVMCLGGLFMAFTLDVRTVPAAAAAIAVVVFFMILSMRLSYPRFSKLQASVDRLNTTVREYLMGIRLVKAFGRFKHERERFDAANGELSSVTAGANRILSGFSPLTSLAVNCAAAAVIFLGARWVGAGDMGVGQIAAFITYMSQLLMSLNMISNILNMFVRTKASALRIAEVMNTEEARDLADGGSAYRFDGVSLSFDNVHFAYPNATGEPALKSVSFDISAGQTLGVIGPTGAGKSTLAALLLKFYDITGGSAYFCGHDIRELPGSVLRGRVAIVPQTPTLFSGTIRDNIAWSGGASEEQIVAAAKAAQAYDFIMSSRDGFQTDLGQGGVNLSGGQRQRLAIARALCANPDVLILDDCTSALDAVTEAKVRDALREYAGNIICVMISQRISSVMGANQILVLDNGGQAGLGTHARLLETCAVYRDVYRSQIGGDTEYAG
ncbi:MAG: ABC transporter ATP-binding protein/permease [Clostridiales bacterium]|jgi:ATP-binding cassette subfamily B protein|nr:ABC transporter ATP-binding protein/permease [Clostridiales bacterium]